MSKTKNYRQCRLTKRAESGTIEQVSFIPEEFAEVGAVLKLKNDNDEWVDGWRVEFAGEKLGAEYVEALERQWKWARPNSDI